MDAFYKSQTGSSAVKATIVTKYFRAWARIILKRVAGDVAYVDLFAGPGCYRDGAASTPVLLLQQLVSDDQLSRRVITVFNDKNAEYASRLRANLAGVKGYEQLRHPPIVLQREVSHEFVMSLRRQHARPWLLFLDPWGYKGLSVESVLGITEQWGCDCIFFFNFNRVNRDIDNPVVAEHMYALFGQRERVDGVRADVESLSGRMREERILHELKSSLVDGARIPLFVLPFRFKEEQQERGSHYLMFVTKNQKAYRLMKDIMFAECSFTQEGVGMFEFDPRVGDCRVELLEVIRPLDELAEDLSECFRGRTLTRDQVIDEHDDGNLFTTDNYRDALLRLESLGRVVVDLAPAKRIRKGRLTLGPTRLITFMEN